MIFPAHRLGEQPGLVGLVGLLKPMDVKLLLKENPGFVWLGCAELQPFKAMNII